MNSNSGSSSVKEKIRQFEQCLRKISNTNSQVTWSHIQSLMNQLYKFTSRPVPEDDSLKFMQCIVAYIKLIMEYNDSNPGDTIREHITVIVQCFSLLPEVLVSIELKNQFVLNATQELLDIFLLEPHDFWCKRHLLKTYNECIEDSDKNARLEVGRRQHFDLYHLIDALSVSGDFDTQSTIMEIIFRVFFGQIESNRATHFIPGDPVLNNFFVDHISADSFDEDIRKFLNAYNKGKDTVFSVPCKNVIFGKSSKCRPPTGLDVVWVDFNFQPKTVTWYCDKACLLENPTSDDEVAWTLITLFEPDVKSVSIKRTKENKIVVEVIYKEACLSNEANTQRFFDKARKRLYLYLEHTYKDTKLITKVLPYMFGNKFKHTTSGERSRPSNVYRPLKIKVSRLCSSASTASVGESTKSGSSLGISASDKHSKALGENSKVSAVCESMRANKINDISVEESPVYGTPESSSESIIPKVKHSETIPEKLNASSVAPGKWSKSVASSNITLDEIISIPDLENDIETLTENRLILPEITITPIPENRIVLHESTIAPTPENSAEFETAPLILHNSAVFSESESPQTEQMLRRKTSYQNKILSLQEPVVTSSQKDNSLDEDIRRLEVFTGCCSGNSTDYQKLLAKSQRSSQGSSQGSSFQRTSLTREADRIFYSSPTRTSSNTADIYETALETNNAVIGDIFVATETKKTKTIAHTGAHKSKNIGEADAQKGKDIAKTSKAQKRKDIAEANSQKSKVIAKITEDIGKTTEVQKSENIAENKNIAHTSEAKKRKDVAETGAQKNKGIAKPTEAQKHKDVAETGAQKNKDIAKPTEAQKRKGIEENKDTAKTLEVQKGKDIADTDAQTADIDAQMDNDIAKTTEVQKEAQKRKDVAETGAQKNKDIAKPTEAQKRKGIEENKDTVKTVEVQKGKDIADTDAQSADTDAQMDKDIAKTTEVQKEARKRKDIAETDAQKTKDIATTTEAQKRKHIAETRDTQKIKGIFQIGGPRDSKEVTQIRETQNNKDPVETRCALKSKDIAVTIDATKSEDIFLIPDTQCSKDIEGSIETQKSKELNASADISKNVEDLIKLTDAMQMEIKSLENRVSEIEPISEEFDLQSQGLTLLADHAVQIHEKDMNEELSKGVSVLDVPLQLETEPENNEEAVTTQSSQDSLIIPPVQIKAKRTLYSQDFSTPVENKEINYVIQVDKQQHKPKREKISAYSEKLLKHKTHRQRLKSKHLTNSEATVPQRMLPVNQQHKQKSEKISESSEELFKTKTPRRLKTKNVTASKGAVSQTKLPVMGSKKSDDNHSAKSSESFVGVLTVEEVSGNAAASENSLSQKNVFTEVKKTPPEQKLCEKEIPDSSEKNVSATKAATVFEPQSSTESEEIVPQKEAARGRSKKRIDITKRKTLRRVLDSESSTQSGIAIHQKERQAETSQETAMDQKMPSNTTSDEDSLPLNKRVGKHNLSVSSQKFYNEKIPDGSEKPLQAIESYNSKESEIIVKKASKLRPEKGSDRRNKKERKRILDLESLTESGIAATEKKPVKSSEKSNDKQIAQSKFSIDQKIQHNLSVSSQKLYSEKIPDGSEKPIQAIESDNSTESEIIVKKASKLRPEKSIGRRNKKERKRILDLESSTTTEEKFVETSEISNDKQIAKTKSSIDQKIQHNLSVSSQKLYSEKIPDGSEKPIQAIESDNSTESEIILKKASKLRPEKSIDRRNKKERTRILDLENSKGSGIATTEENPVKTLEKSSDKQIAKSKSSIDQKIQHNLSVSSQKLYSEKIPDGSEKPIQEIESDNSTESEIIVKKASKWRPEKSIDRRNKKERKRILDLESSTGSGISTTEEKPVKTSEKSNDKQIAKSKSSIDQKIPTSATATENLLSQKKSDIQLNQKRCVEDISDNLEKNVRGKKPTPAIESSESSTESEIIIAQKETFGGRSGKNIDGISKEKSATDASRSSITSDQKQLTTGTTQEFNAEPISKSDSSYSPVNIFYVTNQQKASRAFNSESSTQSGIIPLKQLTTEPLQHSEVIVPCGQSPQDTNDNSEKNISSEASVPKSLVPEIAIPQKRLIINKKLIIKITDQDIENTENHLQLVQRQNFVAALDNMRFDQDSDVSEISTQESPRVESTNHVQGDVFEQLSQKVTQLDQETGSSSIDQSSKKLTERADNLIESETGTFINGSQVTKNVFHALLSLTPKEKDVSNTKCLVDDNDFFMRTTQKTSDQLFQESISQVANRTIDKTPKQMLNDEINLVRTESLLPRIQPVVPQELSREKNVSNMECVIDNEIFECDTQKAPSIDILQENVTQVLNTALAPDSAEKLNGRDNNVELPINRTETVKRGVENDTSDKKGASDTEHLVTEKSSTKNVDIEAVACRSEVQQKNMVKQGFESDTSDEKGQTVTSRSDIQQKEKAAFETTMFSRASSKRKRKLYNPGDLDHLDDIEEINLEKSNSGCDVEEIAIGTSRRDEITSKTRGTNRRDMSATPKTTVTSRRDMNITSKTIATSRRDKNAFSKTTTKRQAKEQPTRTPRTFRPTMQKGSTTILTHKESKSNIYFYTKNIQTRQWVLNKIQKGRILFDFDKVLNDLHRQIHGNPSPVTQNKNMEKPQNRNFKRKLNFVDENRDKGDLPKCSKNTNLPDAFELSGLGFLEESIPRKSAVKSRPTKRKLTFLLDKDSSRENSPVNKTVTPKSKLQVVSNTDTNSPLPDLEVETESDRFKKRKGQSQEGDYIKPPKDKGNNRQPKSKVVNVISDIVVYPAQPGKSPIYKAIRPSKSRPGNVNLEEHQASCAQPEKSNVCKKTSPLKRLPSDEDLKENQVNPIQSKKSKKRMKPLKRLNSDEDVEEDQANFVQPEASKTHRKISSLRKLDSNGDIEGSQRHEGRREVLNEISMNFSRDEIEHWVETGNFSL